MDKTRTLPPLVRGRVTGVLDFFVDKIRLFRNILLLTNNFDLVLQVQWWGELLPVFIRPKEIHVEGKPNRNSPVLESYYHSAQYGIKTTLDLFKTYLKNCEMLELSVLEAFENYVIGSAFLKDLTNVLFSNNELIRMPIFDYLGEEIGEVIIHVNFLQLKPHSDREKIQNEKSEVFKDSSTVKVSEKLGYNIPNYIKSDLFTLAEKTISYDGHSKKKIYGEEKIIEAGLAINSGYFKKNKKVINSNLSLTVSDRSNNLLSRQQSTINDRPTGGIKESTCKCLPEIQIMSDPSKVLHFGVTSQPSRHKTAVKKPNMLVTNKFNSNSIKCKTKQTEKLSKLSSDKPCGKLITKKPVVNCKNLSKSTVKLKKEKEIDSKASSTSNDYVRPEIHPLNQQTNLGNIPSNQSANVKVLDYLLGSDMSKDDEQIALNDFKKMSPSHNLVESISQLCLISEKDAEKSGNKPPNNSPASVKQTSLNFDFNNPIERNYYEKFFLKSSSSPDFEVAVMLNQPENSFKFDEITQQNNQFQSSGLKNFSKVQSVPKRDAEDCLVNTGFPDMRKNSCARCKYYKKLNELDAIIESLKHFEQKMLSHEKGLQAIVKDNSDKIIKMNQY